MESRLHALVGKIKNLSRNSSRRYMKKEEGYYCKIFGKKVTFEEWIKHEQKTFVKKIIPFIREAALLNILTAPIVWAVLPAALLPDLMMTLYQAVCFRSTASPRCGAAITLCWTAILSRTSISSKKSTASIALTSTG